MRWLGVYKAFQMCKNSFSYRCYPQTKTPFSSKTTSEVGVLLNLRVIFNEFCTNSEIRKKGCGFLRSPLGGSKSPNENISLLQRSVWWSFWPLSGWLKGKRRVIRRRLTSAAFRCCSACASTRSCATTPCRPWSPPSGRNPSSSGCLLRTTLWSWRSTACCLSPPFTPSAHSVICTRWIFYQLVATMTTPSQPLSSSSTSSRCSQSSPSAPTSPLSPSLCATT